MKNKSKRIKSNFLTIIFLIALAFIMYYIYYLIFSNLYTTLSNIVFSIAFTPIQILFNMLIIDKILEKREETKYENTINVLIGIFYTEIGIDMLKILVDSDIKIDEIRDIVTISDCWDSECFELLLDTVNNYKYNVDSDTLNFYNITNKLNQSKNLLINLITNPILKEDNDFTNMIILLLHIKDEINNRCLNGKIEYYAKPHIDYEINNFYKLLIMEWISYMKHLQEYSNEYFKFQLINSPFDIRNQEDRDKLYLTFCNLK